MLQRWVDHNGVEHRVLDDYERNVTLCDLTAQPAEVKAAVDSAILTGLRTKPVSSVGIHFMKFCAKHGLEEISKQAESYSRWINSPYTGIYSRAEV
jgi:hypothetical protein